MRVIRTLFIVALLFSHPGGSWNSVSAFLQVQNAAADSPELLEARQLTATAVRLYGEGNPKEALGSAKRALEILQNILPAGDKRVVEALWNLAVIHQKLNNSKEAESLYRRVVAVREANLGREALEAATALDALAVIHYGRGDKGQAEADFKRALAIREKIVGPQSEEVARTLFKLAQLYQFHDELDKAEKLYQRIIASDRKMLPESSQVLIETVDSYACLLRKLKRPDEAKALEDQIEGKILRTKRPPALDGGVLNGKALKLPKPPYPAEARRNRVSGVVVVRVTISEDGRVIHACAESGHRLFWKECEAAAYGAEFEPTMVNGKATRITGVITYKFTSSYSLMLD